MNENTFKERLKLFFIKNQRSSECSLPVWWWGRETIAICWQPALSGTVLSQDLVPSLGLSPPPALSPAGVGHPRGPSKPLTLPSAPQMSCPLTNAVGSCFLISCPEGARSLIHKPTFSFPPCILPAC